MTAPAPMHQSHHGDAPKRRKDAVHETKRGAGEGCVLLRGIRSVSPAMRVSGGDSIVDNLLWDS